MVVETAFCRAFRSLNRREPDPWRRRGDVLTAWHGAVTG
jgi:hypothetical protein